jgi:hypothetical protein
MKHQFMGILYRTLALFVDWVYFGFLEPIHLLLGCWRIGYCSVLVYRTHKSNFISTSIDTSARSTNPSTRITTNISEAQQMWSVAGLGDVLIA